MEKLILRRMGDSGEEMLLNFGPQHPSTHGVINFLVDTDGEVMRRAVPDVGYLHRSLEKIAEKVTWPGYMPYTDRIDYVAAMFANEGYALAVERLLGVEAPPRAQWLRAISCELCRIASHLVAVGTMATDIGATTPLVHALREREAVNDLIEALCGGRLTYNYHRIGGVAYDLPEGWTERVLAFLDHFESVLPEWDRLLSFNTIYMRRLGGVAVISRAKAIDYGLVGPNLRGSGVDWDLRRDVPYGAYPSFRSRCRWAAARPARWATPSTVTTCGSRRWASRPSSCGRRSPPCPRGSSPPRWRASPSRRRARCSRGSSRPGARWPTTWCRTATTGRTGCTRAPAASWPWASWRTCRPA